MNTIKKPKYLKLYLKLLIALILTSTIFICSDLLNNKIVNGAYIYIDYDTDGKVWSTSSGNNGYRLNDLAYVAYVAPETLTNIDASLFNKFVNVRITRSSDTSPWWKGTLYTSASDITNENVTTKKYEDSYYWSLAKKIANNRKNGFLYIPSSMCLYHYQTEANYNYKIYQAFAMELDTDEESDTYGKFVYYNKIASGKTNTAIKRANIDSNLALLCKAFYEVNTTRPYIEDYDEIEDELCERNEGIRVLLYNAYQNSNNFYLCNPATSWYESVSSTKSEWADEIEDEDENSSSSYVETVQNYQAVSAKKSKRTIDNTTYQQISTTYTGDNGTYEFAVVGPIKLVFDRKKTKGHGPTGAQ